MRFHFGISFSWKNIKKFFLPLVFGLLAYLIANGNIAWALPQTTLFHAFDNLDTDYAFIQEHNDDIIDFTDSNRTYLELRNELLPFLDNSGVHYAILYNYDNLNRSNIDFIVLYCLGEEYFKYTYQFYNSASNLYLYKSLYRSTNTSKVCNLRHFSNYNSASSNMTTYNRLYQDINAYIDDPTITTFPTLSGSISDLTSSYINSASELALYNGLTSQNLSSFEGAIPFSYDWDYSATRHLYKRTLIFANNQCLRLANDGINDAINTYTPYIVFTKSAQNYYCYVGDYIPSYLSVGPTPPVPEFRFSPSVEPFSILTSVTPSNIDQNIEFDFYTNEEIDSSFFDLNNTEFVFREHISNYYKYYNLSNFSTCLANLTFNSESDRGKYKNSIKLRYTNCTFEDYDKIFIKIPFDSKLILYNFESDRAILNEFSNSKNIIYDTFENGQLLFSSQYDLGYKIFTNNPNFYQTYLKTGSQEFHNRKDTNYFVFPSFFYKKYVSINDIGSSTDLGLYFYNNENSYNYIFNSEGYMVSYDDNGFSYYVGNNITSNSNFNKKNWNSSNNKDIDSLYGSTDNFLLDIQNDLNNFGDILQSFVDNCDTTIIALLVGLYSLLWIYWLYKGGVS